MNDQTHVDAETLDMLQDMLGDDFPGLLETFLQDAQGKLESLRAGLVNADPDLVRRSAHSLKGSSSNLGANRLADLCLKSERLARDDSLEGLDEVMKEIETEYRAVVDIITKKMENP